MRRWRVLLVIAVSACGQSADGITSKSWHASRRRIGRPGGRPGKPEESLIITAVRRSNPTLNMPPGTQLEAAQIDDWIEWIRMGAPDPRGDSAGAPRDPYDWEQGGSIGRSVRCGSAHRRRSRRASGGSRPSTR